MEFELMFHTNYKSLFWAEQRRDGVKQKKIIKQLCMGKRVLYWPRLYPSSPSHTQSNKNRYAKKAVENCL